MSVARNKNHSRCLDSSRILRGPEGAVIRKADGRAAVGVGKNPEMPPPEPRGGQQSEAGGTRGTAEPRACRGGAAGGPDAQSCHCPARPAQREWTGHKAGAGRRPHARLSSQAGLPHVAVERPGGTQGNQRLAPAAPPLPAVTEQPTPRVQPPPHPTWCPAALL